MALGIIGTRKAVLSSRCSSVFWLGWRRGVSAPTGEEGKARGEMQFARLLCLDKPHPHQNSYETGWPPGHRWKVRPGRDVWRMRTLPLWVDECAPLDCMQSFKGQVNMLALSVAQTNPCHSHWSPLDRIMFLFVCSLVSLPNSSCPKPCCMPGPGYAMVGYCIIC